MDRIGSAPGHLLQLRGLFRELGLVESLLDERGGHVDEDLVLIDRLRIGPVLLEAGLLDVQLQAVRERLELIVRDERLFLGQIMERRSAGGERPLVIDREGQLGGLVIPGKLLETGPFQGFAHSRPTAQFESRDQEHRIVALLLQRPDTEKPGNAVVGILVHIGSHIGRGIALGKVRHRHLHMRELVKISHRGVEPPLLRVEGHPPISLVVLCQGELVVLASQEQQPGLQFARLVRFLGGIPPREVLLIELDVRHVSEAVSHGLVRRNDLADGRIADGPDIDRTGQGELLHEGGNRLGGVILPGIGLESPQIGGHREIGAESILGVVLDLLGQPLPQIRQYEYFTHG